ncbi:MAG: General stress protein 16U [Candidatus Ordinivivax streblomastigis]|uniref:General stress protein 16U n=1 Tax=Candidatus Ordinivivax streblomastigis TaxID=2540710 RepID=A0A5M8NWE5_9BACT|nr:MAG: General stress protein 16U [Candidatus Ordinivivax streblomastigis]
MAINLTKGQRIEIGLSKVGVGLGWDPNEGTGFDFDLDASAFMLGENKKLPQDEFFVFYNNPKSPDDAVESSGDDTTGGSSDGDDETLTVDLAKVSPRIKEIIFTVTIHDFEVRKQNFGQIRNSFIRIYNADTNEEIAKYELDEDFSVETAVEFGRLYKRGSEWKFEAMGIGYRGGLQHFVDKYA